MARVVLPPYVKEIDKLREIYLKAEQDIIESLKYQRAAGYVDYHTSAALQRVQAILQRMVDDAWKYVPIAVEKQYLRGIVAEAGYRNALALSVTQTQIVENLVIQLEGILLETAATTQRLIEESWQEAQAIGRLSPDIYREGTLKGLIAGEATGAGLSAAKSTFLELMKERGVTGFVDKSGRRWSLSAYADMATRTTGRQATNMGVLTADPEQDLYRISSHASACPICAPLEGRVYSRSGTHPDFPPLASAFGKIDLNGANSLENTYLNIHPNCLHVLTAWTEAGRTDEEIQQAKDFSSFEKNPPNINPQSQREIDAYRAKERGRQKWMADYKQWQRYRLIVGSDMPKTFQTFQKHKLAEDDAYKKWQKIYRQRNKSLKDV